MVDFVRRMEDARPELGDTVEDFARKLFSLQMGIYAINLSWEEISPEAKQEWVWLAQRRINSL